LSEQTVGRRLDDSAFRSRLTSVRAKMLDRCIGQLARSLTAASRTLRQLLSAQAETVRLGAARAIVELHGKLHESTELAARLDEVEKLMQGRLAALEELVAKGHKQ
jgi:hypothetical protein